MVAHLRRVRDVLLTEIIATWSFALGEDVLGLSFAAISWARALSYLTAQAVGWVAKLVGWSLRRDHWSYLRCVLKHLFCIYF